MTRTYEPTDQELLSMLEMLLEDAEDRGMHVLAQAYDETIDLYYDVVEIDFIPEGGWFDDDARG